MLAVADDVGLRHPQLVRHDGDGGGVGCAGGLRPRGTMWLAPSAPHLRGIGINRDSKINTKPVAEKKRTAAVGRHSARQEGNDRKAAVKAKAEAANVCGLSFGALERPSLASRLRKIIPHR